MNNFFFSLTALFLPKLERKQLFILPLLMLCLNSALIATAQEISPPPRLVEAPARAPNLPLSEQSPPLAAPKNAVPQLSLESQLQPELKPLPKDPTERAIENTRRLLRERNNKQKPTNSRNDPSNSGVVFIFGEKPNPEPSVGQKLEQLLTPSDELTITTSTPGGMNKIECLRNCTGPFCCLVVERDPVFWKRSGLR